MTTRNGAVRADSRADIEGYLARLGLPRPAQPNTEWLFAAHRAHLERVPYENFEIQLERVTSVNPAESIGRIARGRGGYCFHLNGAFGTLLAGVGYDVTRHLGEVRGGDDDQDEPSLTVSHQVLTVACEGETWFVDTGLGDAPYEPMPLRAGTVTQGPYTYGLEPWDRSARADEVRWGKMARGHAHDGVKPAADDRGIGVESGVSRDIRDGKSEQLGGVTSGDGGALGAADHVGEFAGESSDVGVGVGTFPRTGTGTGTGERTVAISSAGKSSPVAADRAPGVGVGRAAGGSSPHGWRFVHDPKAESFTSMVFAAEPVEVEAFAQAHHRLSTSPDSDFVRSAVAARRDALGADVLRGRVFYRADGRGVTRQTIETSGAWYALLADVYGLHFSDVDAAGRERLWARISEAHERWLAGRWNSRPGGQ